LEWPMPFVRYFSLFSSFFSSYHVTPVLVLRSWLSVI
jgi:hypothetical protein